MNNKKYLIFPGEIISKNDGQKHYISALEIIRLYHVNPQECIIVNNNYDLHGIIQEDYLHLEPNYDGDYQEFIPTVKKLTSVG